MRSATAEVPGTRTGGALAADAGARTSRPLSSGVLQTESFKEFVEAVFGERGGVRLQGLQQRLDRHLATGDTRRRQELVRMTSCWVARVIAT